MAHFGAFWRTSPTAGEGYDWRDRPVVEVDGTLGSAGSIVTYSSYDNWGLTTSVATYAGGGYTMTLAAGVPAATALRSLIPSN